MSNEIFKDQPTETPVEQPVETPKENETAGEYLERLVGPGKKYATVEDLAKSRVFADEHIQRLEDERRQDRERVRKLEDNYSTVTELLHDLRERQARPQQIEEPITREAPAEEPQPSTLTREEVSQIVRQEYQEQERMGQLEKNLDTVYDTLIERFGSEEKANEVLRQQSRDLGMSMKDLEKLASTSPSAFNRLILGGNQRPSTASSLPRSSTNTNAQRSFDAGQQPDEFTWSWFEKIRKEEPERYNSPGFQTMLHRKMIEDPSRMQR